MGCRIRSDWPISLISSNSLSLNALITKERVNIAMQNQLIVISLYVVNAVFALLGIALSAGMVVLYLVALANGASSSAPPPSQPVLWGLVVLGLLIAATALLGCCGLCLRNKVFVLSYTIIVLILLIIQIALIIVIHRPSTDSTGASTSILEFMNTYKDSVPFNILVVLISGACIEALVLVLSCVMLGSQKRRKGPGEGGFYAGRVPAEIAAQHGQIKMDTIGQNPNTGPAYTGPMANDQAEYVEY